MSSQNLKGSRGYKLMLVPFMGGEDYSFSYLESTSLEEIDARFTKNYENLEDMIKGINEHDDSNLDIVKAYIEYSGKEPVRHEIMYKSDNYDPETVILAYSEYLMAHEDYFYRKSPVRFVNIKREDYFYKKDYIKACLLAYFKDRNYRKIRGAYFELKNLGLGRKVCKGNFSAKNDVEYQYYSDNEYIDDLLSDSGGPNWDELYKLGYSIEDYERLIKNERKGRGK